MQKMVHLKSVALKAPLDDSDREFPYSVPVIKAFQKIEFTSPVTFFVGENGSGKSTFLESLACAIGSVTAGAKSVESDETLQAVRAFSKRLRLTWQLRTRKGFFMRAEDFFGYAKRMAQERIELINDLRDAESRFKDRSQTAYDHARAPYAKEIGLIEKYYGEGLDVGSHGECFLKLFKARFVPGGLYLMDEPEVPLSPLRQLSLIAMLKEMVQEENAQFIIATHSPILLAFPEAIILSFDSGRVHAVDYESLEHVTLTRAFLNNPEAYLRHL